MHLVDIVQTMAKRIITNHIYPMDELIARKIWTSYKARSKITGFPFELTREEVKSFIYKNCEYCGNGLGNEIEYYGTKVKYNGMDRKDSSLGYFIGNVATCCRRCNEAKSNMDSQSFIELAHKISRNQVIKNTFSEKKLKYYLDRASSVAKASPDPSTKVGALLIHRDSGAVVAEGFNGFIRGAPDEIIPTTRPEKYDYIIHAEMNLLCNAVRHGISSDKCIIFSTMSPCIKCVRALFQAGIKEVYVKNFYTDFIQNSNMLDLSLSVTTIGEFSRIEIKPKIHSEKT